ncbi:hypothetical protein H5410_013477, partial [Solanum commersonii]
MDSNSLLQDHVLDRTMSLDLRLRNRVVPTTLIKHSEPPKIDLQPSLGQMWKVLIGAGWQENVPFSASPIWSTIPIKTTVWPFTLTGGPVKLDE